MNAFKVILFIGVIFVLMATALYAAPTKSSSALSAKQYEETKAKYFKLRNTDTKLQEADQWISVKAEFSDFLNSFPESAEGPRVLLHIASIDQKFYEQKGNEEHLQQSFESLRAITNKYPASDLADDALVKEGDLLIASKNEDAAKECYEKVIRNYPQSDMYEVAKARLRKEKPIAKQAKVVSGHPLVVIDPGHGGEDTGAEGHGGLLEKDIALLVALELEKLLIEELNIKVVLTRRTDQFVPLKDRTDMANDYEADIFISLHANASPSKKLSGFETYYLDMSGDEASKLLAERENASARKGQSMSDLDFILSDMIQAGKMDESIHLAKVLHKRLLDSLSTRWGKQKDLGVKRAPFYVLVGAHMPCILMELSFIDNPADGARLLEKDYRRDIANGIYQGIKEYLG